MNTCTLSMLGSRAFGPHKLLLHCRYPLPVVISLNKGLASAARADRLFSCRNKGLASRALGGRRLVSSQFVTPTHPSPSHWRLGGIREHATNSNSASSSQISNLKVDIGEKKLRVSWKDGHESVYHAVWLRHNCQCSECLTSSNQKNLAAEDLEGDIKITSTCVNGDGLEVVWSKPRGEHRGYINLDWLRENCYSEKSRRERKEKSTPLVATSLPKLDYSEDDEHLWKWLKTVNEYGICLLKGVPTKDAQMKRIAEKISHVQKTIFSEVFDIIAMDDATNIAYMTLGLEPHMDLVYYHSPPGLSLLHCLRNDSCVKGGESILLDAYPVLEEMRITHPTHFKTLTTVPATFQQIHSDGPVKMLYQRPHIVLDRDERIVAINWCPPSDGPLHVSEDEVEPYYEAYSCLTRMFMESKLKFTHRLDPGDVITFNNSRFLHGRTSFELNGGVRHLQGVYVNIDEFKSKLQVLASKYDKTFIAKHVFNHCLL